MSATFSRWMGALYAALRARVGTPNADSLPALDDPRRKSFDREFDALIAEMAQQLPAAPTLQRH
jgi:hypothetical protein